LEARQVKTRNCSVIRTLGLLAGTAAAVAGLDLAQKAFSISERGSAVLVHARPTSYVAGLAVAVAVWAGAILRARSASIAVAGGVVLGGAMGNLASIALWPSLAGVPDPIVAGGVAFNVADVAVAAGFVLLLPATALFGLKNRERLFEPA
jgi:lipoprotein signal peptidase